MKKSRLICLFTFAFVALSVSGVNLFDNNQVRAEPTPETSKTDENVQLLFVQNSISGSYDGKRLTLNGIGSTLFFSDRPERVAGQVRTSEFISHWDKGSDNFAANPPNATLSIFKENGVDSVVVELTEPKLQNNSLSYEVRVLKGEIPSSFQESSLFIDILGRWRMYSYGVAAGAAAAGAANYYYHPPVVTPVTPVVTPGVPVTPVVTPPVYVAPRPILFY